MISRPFCIAAETGCYQGCVKNKIDINIENAGDSVNKGPVSEKVFPISEMSFISDIGKDFFRCQIYIGAY